MKKLYFLAISVFALASCSHDLGDYERDAYPTLTKEQIKQNVQEVLGTKVEVKCGRNPQKGTLVIHYHSVEQLNNIADRLKNKML